MFGNHTRFILAAVAASLTFVPSALAADTKSSSWTDTRTHQTYPMTCQETQSGTGAGRTETFSCTFTGANAPAGTYKSPKSYWNSDYDNFAARKVSVTISGNHLQGTASDFIPNTTTFSTTWMDTRTGITYYIRCNETKTENSDGSRTETFDCQPSGAKAPAGTYGPAQHAYWDSDFTPGLHSDTVNITIDKKGHLTGSATYANGGDGGSI